MSKIVVNYKLSYMINLLIFMTTNLLCRVKKFIYKLKSILNKLLHKRLKKVNFFYKLKFSL